MNKNKQYDIYPYPGLFSSPPGALGGALGVGVGLVFLKEGPICNVQGDGWLWLLKVHKNENFFGFDFEFCTISLLVMSKY